MLEYFIKKSRRERLEQDSFACSGGEEGAMESETESEDDIELIENDDGTNTREAGRMNLEEIKCWAPVVPYGTINFLDQVETGESSRRGPYTAATYLNTGIPTDFALISGLREFKFENSYLSSTGIKRVSNAIFDNLLLSKEREVLIILNPEGDPVSGLIVPTNIPLVINDVTLLTIKICLSTPLSKFPALRRPAS